MLLVCNYSLPEHWNWDLFVKNILFYICVGHFCYSNNEWVGIKYIFLKDHIMSQSQQSSKAKHSDSEIW